MKRLTSNAYYLLYFFISCIISNYVFADPVGRIARISYISGVASFLPASETKWVQAKLNRPLILGDSLWSDTDSKIELQLGWASVRLGNKSSVQILNLDQKIA